MDATFLLPRSARTLGLWCLPAFLTWGAWGLRMALTDPDVPHRAGAVALMGGIPLTMAGMSLWLIVATWRHELTLRGTRVICRGVVGRREIDLGEVTSASWRAWTSRESVVLRSGSARLVVDLESYGDAAREAIVRHLRSGLPPEVQTGWNLFAYQVAGRTRRSATSKPGKDEVLLRRDRWDRLIVPGVLGAAAVGGVAWWSTGDIRLLIAAPLAPLAGWGVLRASTPVEGLVVPKLLRGWDPDTSRSLAFLISWGFLGLVAIALVEGFRPRLTHPEATACLVGFLWCTALPVEVFLLERRRYRHACEAADLAAKARGETGTGPEWSE